MALTNFIAAVRQSIYTHVEGPPVKTFFTSLGGRLYYNRAPKCAPGSGAGIVPYAVYSFPGLPEENTFSETIYNGIVQFCIYAADDITCERLLTECLSAYSSAGAEEVNWIGNAEETQYIANYILNENIIIPPYKSTDDKFANSEVFVDFHIRFQRIL